MPRGIQNILSRLLKAEIEVREVDANIDDPVFAQAIVAAFEQVVRLKDTG